MKIGLLKADSVLPQFREEFGDYLSMFDEILKDADSSLELVVYDVEHGEYPQELDECDGYVISGSRRSVYEDEPWIHDLGKFVLELHRAHKKTVGICFGHQLIAMVLGGETHKVDVGWGVGVQTTRLISHESFMASTTDRLALVYSHQDQVTRLPGEARLIAQSDFCPNAAFIVGNHFLTFQGHPEFDQKYSRALMDMRREILGEETYQAGVASLDLDTDRNLVAHWMLAFIGDQATPDSQTIMKVPSGFLRFKEKARAFLREPGQLNDLLNQAIAKARDRRGALDEVWDDLISLIRLLRAWVKGDYRSVSSQTMLIVITALLYFVTPFDVIPDFLLVFGFIDDAAIITYVISLLRDELRTFKQWESGSSTMIIKPEDNPLREKDDRTS